MNTFFDDSPEEFKAAAESVRDAKLADLDACGYLIAEVIERPRNASARELIGHLMSGRYLEFGTTLSAHVRIAALSDATKEVEAWDELTIREWHKKRRPPIADVA